MSTKTERLQSDQGALAESDANSSDNALGDLAGPFLRFRIAAYLTGVGLLGLCVVMVLRYGFDNATPSAVYSPIHGVLYMLYVVAVIDLAIKARWAIKNTVLVLIAGCVPFVSFVVERWASQRMRNNRGL